MVSRTGRSPDTNRRGFTLVELMIVIAILAIIVSIAVPNFVRARVSANETSALSSLRTIGTVSERYRLRYGRYPSGFGDLVSSGHLDEKIGSGSKSGYTFSYTGAQFDFSCIADPDDPGVTGTRYFFIDVSGVIRFSSTGTATSTSAPVGE